MICEGCGKMQLEYFFSFIHELCYILCLQFFHQTFPVCLYRICAEAQQV